MGDKKFNTILRRKFRSCLLAYSYALKNAKFHFAKDDLDDVEFYVTILKKRLELMELRKKEVNKMKEVNADNSLNVKPNDRNQIMTPKEIAKLQAELDKYRWNFT